MHKIYLRCTPVTQESFFVLCLEKPVLRKVGEKGVIEKKTKPILENKRSSEEEEKRKSHYDSVF